jgi:hypothetical protein
LKFITVKKEVFELLRERADGHTFADLSSFKEGGHGVTFLISEEIEARLREISPDLEAALLILIQGKAS